MTIYGAAKCLNYEFNAFSYILFAEIVRKQAEHQSIIKKSAAGRPEHAHQPTSHSKLTSKLKGGKVTPIITTNGTHSNGGINFESDSANHNGENCNNLTNHRPASPAFSDRTDRTNRSIKRVAFTDQPATNLEHQDKLKLIMNGSEGDVRTISGSPTDRNRAKRKRERALRKRLLDKMGEAEVG